jgi:hypothetical protein
MNNGAWQSHEEDCDCAGCSHQRAFMQLTSEMLEELDPTPPSLLVPIIKEMLAWGAAIGCILLMLRCSL